VTLNLSNPLNLCAIKRKVHLFGPDDSPRLNECARLRYTYFVQKRGWVAPNPVYPDVEQDSYDEHCLHLGVWDNKGVTAYLRALPFDFHIGFMLDHDLSCLIENEDQKTLLRDGAVELSRLVVRPDIVFCQADPHPVEMLLRLLYREAKMRGFRRFYIVVEEGRLSVALGCPFASLVRRICFLMARKP